MTSTAVAKPFFDKKYGFWKVAYKDATGRLVQRTTGTSNYDDAVALLEQWKTEVYTGKKRALPLKYKTKDFKSIVDEAVKDGRISLKEANKIKELEHRKLYQKIHRWFNEVDGKLVYVKKGTPSSNTWPYRDVPKSVSKLQEYKDSKNRVKSLINSIKDDISKEELASLRSLNNNIANVKSMEDVLEWEKDFRTAYAPIKRKVSLENRATAEPRTKKNKPVPKTWREIARNSINTDLDSWVTGKIQSSMVRHFRDHPDVISGKISKSTLATDYRNNLSDAELKKWFDKYRPIKIINDGWHQVALDSGDPKYLDNVIEAHHTMPLKPGGTGLRPTNIVGAEGSGFDFSAEHGRMHTPFANTLFGDLGAAGVEELNYNPQGLGDVKTKISKPRWDKKSKKVVYDVLDANEWVHGIPEYKWDARLEPQRGAGLSDSPPHKISLLNLAKGFGGQAYNRVIPYGFGTLLGLGLAGFSDKGWASDQFKKTVKDRSFWFENFLGLHPQKVASDPRRVSPWRIGATLGQDTASGIGGLLRGLLRTDDPTEDDYVAAQQMGRSPDMSMPQIYDNGKPTGIFGHPGIREEIIRKRRPNIWT